MAPQISYLDISPINLYLDTTLSQISLEEKHFAIMGNQNPNLTLVKFKLDELEDP